MWYVRVIYGILVALSVIAFFISDSAVALILLFSLVLVPLANYALMIRFYRRLKITAEPPERRFRNERVCFKFTVRSGFPLLLGSVFVRLQIENATFSEVTERDLYLTDFSERGEFTYSFPMEYSGKIRIRFLFLQLDDFFRLFPFSKKMNLEEEVIVSPKLYENLETQLASNRQLIQLGDVITQVKRGQDHTELFDTRDYREGDAQNAIHWKLSSKFDSLVVKEFGDTTHYQVLLLADLSFAKEGQRVTKEILNEILDLQISMSNALRVLGIPHCMGWMNDGDLVTSPVLDQASFLTAIDNQAGMVISQEDSKALFAYERQELARQFTKLIVFSPFEEREALDRVSCLSDTTMIIVSEEVGEVSKGDARVIYLTSEMLNEVLRKLSV